MHLVTIGKWFVNGSFFDFSTKDKDSLRFDVVLHRSEVLPLLPLPLAEYACWYFESLQGASKRTNYVKQSGDGILRSNPPPPCTT